MSLTKKDKDAINEVPMLRWKNTASFRWKDRPSFIWWPTPDSIYGQTVTDINFKQRRLS